MYRWTYYTWLMFHLVTIQIKHEYRKKYIEFFNLFNILIPCGYCRSHYQRITHNKNMNIEKNVNGNNIFNWTIDLHSCINKKNNKRIWSYNEGLLHYQSYKIKKDQIIAFIYIYYTLCKRRNKFYTQSFIQMINAFIYIMPNIEFKDKLLNYSEKTPLTMHNIDIWVQEIIKID